MPGTEKIRPWILIWLRPNVGLGGLSQSNYQCRSSQLSSSIFPKESICPYDLRGYVSTATILWYKKVKIIIQGWIYRRQSNASVGKALVNIEHLEGHDPHVPLDMLMNYYYCYYNESLITRSIQLFCEFMFELPLV